jgi:hypothetical protein
MSLNAIASPAARKPKAVTLSDRLVDLTLWMPNWSPTSCDLGVFVYQTPESVAASEVRVG